MDYYQTDALSEDQCSLISEALKNEVTREQAGSNDSDRIAKLNELAEMFDDPSGNLIEVDPPEEDEDDEDENEDNDDD